MDKGLLYLLLIFGAGWLITDEFFGKGLITKFVQSSLTGTPTFGAGGSIAKKQANDQGTVTGIPKQITPINPGFMTPPDEQNPA